MANMKWNVFYHDPNKDSIEVFNIFEHSGFFKDIEDAHKECKNKDDFAIKLESSLLYYFWSKCEWETIITPWCGSQINKPKKVDVYWQVMNCWDAFVDYVWTHYNSK